MPFPKLIPLLYTLLLFTLTVNGQEFYREFRDGSDEEGHFICKSIDEKKLFAASVTGKSIIVRTLSLSGSVLSTHKITISSLNGTSSILDMEAHPNGQDLIIAGYDLNRSLSYTNMWRPILMSIDPENEKINWINTSNSPTSIYCIDIDAANNTILVGNTTRVTPSQQQDTQLNRIDLNTGNQIGNPALVSMYHNEHFANGIINGNRVYYTGRFTPWAGNEETYRATISIFDLSSNHLKTLALYEPIGPSQRLYGRGLAIEGDALYVSSYGNRYGTSMNSPVTFLSKHDLDGNIDYAYTYNFTGYSTEVVASMIHVSDGLILFGSSETSVLLFAKVNFDGEVIWAKKVSPSNGALDFPYKNFPQATQINDTLYVSCTLDKGGQSSSVVFNITPDGEVSTLSCINASETNISRSDYSSAQSLLVSPNISNGYPQVTHSAGIQNLDQSDTCGVFDVSNEITICSGEEAQLNASGGTSYEWSPASGLSCTSCPNPIARPNTSQTYTVRIEDAFCCASVNLEVEVNVVERLIFDLGSDTTLCEGESILLSSGFGTAQHVWQDGSSNTALEVKESGIYHLTLNPNTCPSSDTIEINFAPRPEVDLGPDTLFCEGNSLTLDATGPGLTYLWQDQSTKPTFEVNTSGIYYVEVSNGTCSNWDSIEVVIQSYQAVNLGNDTSLCEGEVLGLDASAPNASYRWQDGSSNANYNVTEPGTYHVTLNPNSCPTSDTIEVGFLPAPEVDLGPDTVICEGSSLTLNAYEPGLTYKWQDQSTQPFLQVNSTGLYYVEVNDGNCSNRDSIEVKVQNFEYVYLGEDMTLCEGDFIVLDASTNDSEYLWQDGSTSPSYFVNSPGKYYVTLNPYTCPTSDTININFTPKPSINIGPDTIICTGDTLVLNASYPGASYQWQDGSTADSLVAFETGLYHVSLEAGPCQVRDSIYIEVKPDLNVDLGNDLNLCGQDSLVLSPGFSNANYLWHDGSTQAEFTVREPGEVSVTVNPYTCPFSDTIQVYYHIQPEISLGQDTSICQGDTISFDFSSIPFNILWNDSSTEKIKQISTSSELWVQAQSEFCMDSDSIQISVYDYPKINLGGDTAFCSGDTLIINLTNPNCNFLWNTGNTNGFIEIFTPGEYWVEADRMGCKNSDSLQVYELNNPVFNLPLDSSICQGDSLLLNSGLTVGNHLWNDGDTSRSKWVKEPSWYQLTVTDSICSHTDSIQVDFKPVPQIQLGSDTNLCLSDQLFIDIYSPIATGYLWNDKDSSSSKWLMGQGVFEVEVFYACGSVFDRIEIVKEDCSCDVFIPNGFTPDGNQLNDLFQPVFTCDPIYYELLIYDRWGKEVFRTNKPDEAWDGSLNMKWTNNDIYAYKIVCQFENSLPKTYRGSITIIQ